LGAFTFAKQTGDQMRFLSVINSKSALLAMALFGLAGMASANEINVHVPVTARWGSKVLPAGDYKFIYSLESPFARLSGNGTEALVFVKHAEATTQLGGSGFLKIVDKDGTPSVAEFSSGTRGRLFEFAVPKSTGHAHTASNEAAHGL
jgi:hypothetical protein